MTQRHTWDEQSLRGALNGGQLSALPTWERQASVKTRFTWSAAAVSRVLSAKSLSVGDSLLEYGSGRIHQTAHPEIAGPGDWGQIGDSDSTLLFPVAHWMHQSVVI